MERLSTMVLRLHLLVTAPDRPRDERGDVPGWVMITVMTVSVVGVIWGVAEGTLSQMLKDGLASLSKK
jgi:hypothetical protein